MKAQTESKIAVARNKYTPQFKEQALERADKDGIPKAANDLGLAESMLYNWRAKRHSPSKIKSYSKPKWRGLNEKTPDWKRKLPF